MEVIDDLRSFNCTFIVFIDVFIEEIYQFYSCKEFIVALFNLFIL